MNDDARSGPLAGVRVVALEQAVALPYATFVLAELGADVVKIERPGTGDVVRGWDDAVRGLSTGYVWLNAGKRDVAVDLATEEGREILRRLAATADVFVENFAPGVVGRLGLAYEDFAPGNEGLVYASLSGYGQSGPYREVKAYDLLIQGETGLILTNGYPDAPAKVGVPVTDLIAGTNVAIGVLSALYERERSGRGAYLDVSLFESTLLWLGYFPQYHWHTGAQPERSGLRHHFVAPYGPYLGGDGRYVNLVVASDAHWRIFCEQVVLRPEWLDDPRFATIVERQRNRPALEAAVEEVIATQAHDVWLRRLRDAGLPAGEVREVGEAVEHPQALARRAVVDATSPVGPLPLVRFTLGDPERPRHVPGLGEHTDEILAEAGYSATEVSRLRDTGVV